MDKILRQKKEVEYKRFLAVKEKIAK
jgi:hypothetical protein